MEIEELKALYFPNEIDVDAELFLPICKVASSIKCMSGYFTSGFLSELASAIFCYIKSNNESIKFIISPNLSEEDIEIILKAQSANEDTLGFLFPNYAIETNLLRSKTLDAFFYLIATNKIELKIALMKEGVFHTKAWIFETPKGLVTIHGSGNATASGLSHNFEQLNLSIAWKTPDACETCNELNKRFHSIWDGSYRGIYTFPVNEASLLSIRQYANSKNLAENQQNLLSELQAAYDENQHKIKMEGIKPQRLKVPNYLNFTKGAFAHQGEAVDAWLNNSCMGILSIATGGGKTLTSLIAASKVNEQVNKFFLVIAVPTRALLDQWAEDVRAFGVEPINSNGKNKKILNGEIREALRKIKIGASFCEALILTHEALKSDLMDVLKKSDGQITYMFIGDEVHNLGSRGFIQNAPQFFRHKLGLSATYERQFDEDGTQFLKEYFGPVVFEYSLEEAIGNCLVPYDYFVHKAYLTASEEDEFKELTEKIRALSYAANLPDGDKQKDLWNSLCIKRRKVVETAENKIIVFKEIFEMLRHSRKIEKTLIFCTDKDGSQLAAVNNYLNTAKIHWHQITSSETSSRKRLETVVDQFRSNEYQVLTAMRVLDEGFNIPQTETAFLLSSNTVRRQWAQRLGRILRTSKSTGKTKATLHDFLVIPISPAGIMDSDLKALIRSECERVIYFAKLSNNFAANTGALTYVSEMLSSLEDDNVNSL